MLRFAAERGDPVFSFEFFPPKSEEGRIAFIDAVRRLHPLAPAFVSVTWGAGGSTRGRTLETVLCCKREFEIEAMAHVTCVGTSRGQLTDALNELLDAGVENVLALRGDPPRGARELVPARDGLSYANELVELARGVAAKRNQPLCIGAACYPEGHLECQDPQADLEHLKVKVNAGVDFLITQLFFDNRRYFDFVGRARAAGIEVPIIPGLMPIGNVDQVQRLAALCGAAVPAPLAAALRARREDAEGALQLGVAQTALQAADLLRGGAPGIHFYTLNKSPATRAILAALRVAEPWRSARGSLAM
jgi:methylenetetrahydrofolate reductase (NADPH)